MINKIFVIIIGVFLTFILFFPVNYKTNKEKIHRISQKEIHEIYQQYKIPYQNNFQIHKENSKLCFLVFSSDRKKFQDLPCVLYVPVVYPNSLENILEWVQVHYLYLRKQYQNIVIITTNSYHVFAFFLASHYPDVFLMIFEGNLYDDIPLIWSIIEPRICSWLKVSSRCVYYQTHQYVHRKEIYEKIRQPAVLIIKQNALFHSKTIQKTLEIFHALGNLSVSTRKIYFYKDFISYQEIIKDIEK